MHIEFVVTQKYTISTSKADKSIKARYYINYVSAYNQCRTAAPRRTNKRHIYSQTVPLQFYRK